VVDELQVHVVVGEAADHHTVGMRSGLHQLPISVRTV
jgi:hypothetical protein